MRFTGSTNTIENEEVVPVVNFVMAEQEKRSDMYFVGFHLFFSSSLFDCLSLLLVAQKKKMRARNHTQHTGTSCYVTVNKN